MKHIKVLEPRVNIKPDDSHTHVVLQGGLRITENVFPADSWGSAGVQPIQATWSIFPPSTQTIVDRYVRARLYLEVKVDEELEIGANDSLCQFPVATMTDTLTVTLNGTGLSDNVADKIHGMLCYGNRIDDRNKSWATTPAMPDMYQEYGDWKGTAPGLGGSAKNPMAAYGENSAEDPRGGFPYVIAEDNKSFTCVVTEPVTFSPFFSGIGPQQEGFVNVNQMNFVYRWKTNLSHLLSHSDLSGHNIRSVSVSMYAQPELLINYITPDLLTQIPRLQVLPYYKSLDYPKAFASVAANTDANPMISDSIKLSQIPRKMFIFIRHNRATQYDQLISDSFMGITNLSVLWNNQNSLISTASQQELFEMSRRNGSNLSWCQFSKFRGSVLCVEFGKDIGLLDNEAPGVQGQYTIQVTVRARNLSSSAFEPELFLVFMMEGTLSIAENMARTSIGNLTPSEVLNAKQSPGELDYAEYEELQGGGFFQNLKHFLGKLARGVSGAVGVATKLSPAVTSAFPELAPFAAALPAVGRVSSALGDALGSGIVGGQYVGGRRRSMSRGGRRQHSMSRGGAAELHLGDSYGPGEGQRGGRRKSKKKSMKGSAYVGGRKKASMKGSAYVGGRKKKSSKKGGALLSSMGGVMRRR